MSKRTNEQWLADLVADDAPQQMAALEDLHVRLQRGIYYYLSRERSDLATRSPSDLQQMANDFAQEAILRVLKNPDSFRGDSQFTTWATKVAVRVAISELRRARYRDFSLEALTVEGELMPDISTAFGSDSVAGPEKSTERMDVMEKINRAIQEVLTERQRAALQAIGLRGLPMDVVAEQMGTNRNALYKLLHDARRKLKAALEGEGITMDYLHHLFE
jgi:RNA polymerase sigma-70 factor (ECF subfamily)